VTTFVKESLADGNYVSFCSISYLRSVGHEGKKNEQKIKAKTYSLLNGVNNKGYGRKKRGQKLLLN
jgi:hypothetical protein